MNKTAALRAARGHVSKITRRGPYCYSYTEPHDYADPAGPVTEKRANTYTQAVAARSVSVAGLALSLMGFDVLLRPGWGRHEDGTTTRELLAAGIKRAAETLETQK